MLSFATLNILLIGVPGLILSLRTIIPSCESPNPISSSAHTIPLLTTPLIFDFLIFISIPSFVYIFDPTGATGTTCPFFILGAPQTISEMLLFPRSIEVTFNLSAFGCFVHSRTLPAMTPFRPPLIDSKGDSFSTSKPKLVKISEI